MSKVPHSPSYSSHLPSTNKNPNPYAVDGEPPINPSRLSSSNTSHVNSSGNSRILEKNIKTIQTLQKIPYAEARKQVVPKGGLSYSQVAAKPSQTTNIAPAVQALVPQITAAVSDSAKDKRKRNKSGSTDPGSAREDDLSVIDSSAESNEELSTGKKKKKEWPLGKPRQAFQGGNR
ncbi:hypothetical protein ILUMI_22411 [Ignelater luminosus]|uniref:Uncharacterized protein n=1 Tax=Ignelater luminosus TaxID=2038154 RepID=A0A8K0CEJ6_IGNLU|nr:hypothetical protein ILUMI_22411 [Ignelater luminosus]